MPHPHDDDAPRHTLRVGDPVLPHPVYPCARPGACFVCDCLAAGRPLPVTVPGDAVAWHRAHCPAAGA